MRAMDSGYRRQGSDGRDMRHGWQRWFLGWFLGFAVALSVVAEAAGDSPDDALVGQYRHSSVFTAGETRRSVASIARVWIQHRLGRG